jgi:transketolase
LALSAFEILKAKGINAMLWNFSSPLEPDFEALKIAASTGIIVTVEDHNVRTGLGNIIANTLFELRLMPEFRKLGVTNYSFSASPQDLYKMECFDPQGIANEIENILLD